MKRYLFVFVAVLFPAAANATFIQVSGDQTGIWSADTVIVTGEVRVPPGESLTIIPGVEVLFRVYGKFIVDNAAKLYAVGTPGDSIRFDILPPNTHWHGLRFLVASQLCRLEYCQLTHGEATGSGDDCKGGAIYCWNSNPTISHCTISRNTTNYGGGGGIYLLGSSPIISNNTIRSNQIFFPGTGGYSHGGGIYCFGSNPVIIGNLIIDNTIHGENAAGGGIHCFNSAPTICGNTISGNLTTDGTWIGGGGIGLDNSNPTISDNIISGNSVTNGDWINGGGISCDASNPTIIGNTITGNFLSSGGGTYDGGGGINCTGCNPAIVGNTICDNHLYGGGWNSGGGIWCDGSPTVVNCIIKNNSGPGIQGSPLVTYSDVGGGFPGTGNINADPAFVDTAQHDYRLLWGSPCIDSGDPDSSYHDPDHTRADMGAWFFDQSKPVRLLMTPYNAPLQIPSGGGEFDFLITVSNTTNSPMIADLWTAATLPSHWLVGPLWDSLAVTIPADGNVSILHTQRVPGTRQAAPKFVSYQGYAAMGSDTSSDSFTFCRLAPSDQTDSGEPIAGKRATAEALFPSGFLLSPCHPNPFNPTTIISFTLPEASRVSLNVYDTSGRLVTTLVDGWRQAGLYNATFNGSNLSSGVYLYTLNAGKYSATGKMALLK